MLDRLLDVDEDLFLFLNDLHASWLDQPMWYCSNTLTWTPLYIILAYLVVKDFKRESWMIFIGITLTIVLSDQIASSLIKPWIERLRPSRDPSLQDLIHYVGGYRGGLYGFVSSHAANTFGTATFLVLLYKNQRRGMWILFFWAGFVSYTRIYLGVHYPGDIIGGALVGICMAFFSFWVIEQLRKRWRTAEHQTY